MNCTKHETCKDWQDGNLSILSRIVMPSDNYTVIDEYFKPWIVDAVSYYYEHYPVTFTNSSKATYEDGSRFFGTIIMEHETWKVPQELNSWFNHLLRGSIINDILKDKVLINFKSNGIKVIEVLATGLQQRPLYLPNNR